MRSEKIEYAALFALGLLLALSFNFFMRQHAIYGIISLVLAAASALYLWSDDAAQELSLFKVIPERLAMIAVILQARIVLGTMRAVAKLRATATEMELRMHKTLRESRQKKLLERNRMFRTRRLLSTS